MEGIDLGRRLRPQADMGAAFMRYLAHAPTQIDPELRIGLAESDRPRPCHQPRETECGKCCFVEAGGAFEIGDTDGDVVVHLSLPLSSWRKPGPITTGFGLAKNVAATSPPHYRGPWQWVLAFARTTRGHAGAPDFTSS